MNIFKFYYLALKAGFYSLQGSAMLMFRPNDKEAFQKHTQWWQSWLRNEIRKDMERSRNRRNRKHK